MTSRERDLELLERGAIHFFYTPRVEEGDPDGVEDIQNLFVLLSPDERGRVRRLIIGRKQLPDEERHQRLWGFVDASSPSLSEAVQALERREYTTSTRGERTRPPARPAGEGIYALVHHVDHTHLVHRLDEPDDRGEVQSELGVDPEASYIVAAKNPDAPSPPGAGLAPSQRPDLPDELADRFGSRRWTPADPELLDVEHLELVLIGSSEDPEEELGIDLDLDDGEVDLTDILALLESDVPTEPVTEGDWA